MSHSQKRALSPAANSDPPLKKCRCHDDAPLTPSTSSSPHPSSIPPMSSTSSPPHSSSTPPTSSSLLHPSSPADASFMADASSKAAVSSAADVSTAADVSNDAPTIPDSVTTLTSAMHDSGSRFTIVGIVQHKSGVMPYRGGGGFFMEFLLADTTGGALVEVAKMDGSLLPKDAEIGDVLCVGSCKLHKNRDRLISYADRSTYRYWSIRLQRWMNFGFMNPRAFKAMRNRDGQLDANPYTKFTSEVSGYARYLPVMMETPRACTAQRCYSLTWEGDSSGWREVKGELSVLNTDPPQMWYCLECQVFTHPGTHCIRHPGSKPALVWSGIFQLHGDETTEIHMCGAFADISTGEGDTAEEALSSWMEKVVDVTSCMCGSCKVTTTLQVMDISAKIQGPKGTNREDRCIVRPFHILREH
ncbi:uncharacterized protein EI90DRAFT_3021909 [Cantharellus anzutake]|uniref:uncharacterized protein n=1 Tax=Cantharellus anzutake TaxID=1750568 RepID=UPI001906A704|nr:uncharacterized protein EI90DRAFT_3021909 [Cantharellus anzutake]KAF8315518.1 hypothetical protein EI90DRAFT_3021909 [Cantharellus anzutake]